MKNRSKITLIALGLALAVAGCSNSNTNTTDKASNNNEAPASLSSDKIIENAQPIVSQISGGSYKISKTFDGPENSGLVGLLLDAQGGGAKQVGWATHDGKLVSPGPLFNAQGENLNEKAQAEHGGLLSANDLATRIVDENMGFVAGKSGPVMTVFFEPYCGYCNRLFDQIKPMIDKGEIRVRFLLVPFLRPDSAARSAEIAFASNPYKALSDWEKRSDKAEAPAPQADAEQQAQIQSYGALFNEANLGGTPATLMCDKNTGKLEVIRGFPPNLADQIKNISEEGHPICKG